MSVCLSVCVCVCVFLEGVSNYDSTCREYSTAVSKLPGIVFSSDNRHPDRAPAVATVMSPPLYLLPPSSPPPFLPPACLPVCPSRAP